MCSNRAMNGLTSKQLTTDESMAVRTILGLDCLLVSGTRTTVVKDIFAAAANCDCTQLVRVIVDYPDDVMTTQFEVLTVCLKFNLACEAILSNRIHALLQPKAGSL